MCLSTRDFEATVGLKLCSPVLFLQRMETPVVVPCIDWKPPSTTRMSEQSPGESPGLVSSETVRKGVLGGFAKCPWLRIPVLDHGNATRH